MPQPTGSISLDDYSLELRHRGRRVYARDPNALWVDFERGSIMRLPTFCLTPVDEIALQNLLRQNRLLAAAYAIEPSPGNEANGWSYECGGGSYESGKLSPEVQRNIRRGRNNLRFSELSRADVLEHAYQAYADTRVRLGLSDSSQRAFVHRFSAEHPIVGERFWGMWLGTEVVAFISTRDVEDWAEIEGSFSTTAHLNMRPNDTLLVTYLEQSLNVRGKKMVSFGLSSIQAGGHDSLHRFKVKLGFIAVPIHRKIILHPTLERIGRGRLGTVVRFVSSLAPENRWLRKASGLLTAAAGEGGSTSQEKSLA